MDVTRTTSGAWGEAEDEDDDTELLSCTYELLVKRERLYEYATPMRLCRLGGSRCLMLMRNETDRNTVQQ